MKQPSEKSLRKEVIATALEMSRSGPALIQVFDLQGRLVRNLADGERPPGQYETVWDGRDAAGRRVASGIYPYRLQVAGETLTRKMVVLR